MGLGQKTDLFYLFFFMVPADRPNPDVLVHLSMEGVGLKQWRMKERNEWVKELKFNITEINAASFSGKAL